MDGNKVTETEFRTIEFIIASYQCDEDMNARIPLTLGGVLNQHLPRIKIPPPPMGGVTHASTCDT